MTTASRPRPFVYPPPDRCQHNRPVAGVFTGVATYDDFSVLDPDISEILLLVAPRETPFLDLLPAASRPAISVKHTWVEENIGPDRIISSVAVDSASADTGVRVAWADGTSSGGPGSTLQVGMLVELESSAGAPEVCQINSIAGPTSLLLKRNINAKGNSLVAGGTIFIIGTTELEGDDTDGDVSRPRIPSANYTQIFKKPIKISGSRQAVLTAPNVGSEIDHQETNRTIELLRDLEKAVIRSVSIGTIGDDSTYRSMNGTRALITAINSTLTGTSFTADPLLYTNNLMQAAWNAGARDLDLLLTGGQWGRDISATNAAKLYVLQADTGVQRVVERITTDFGDLRKVVSPWMPNYSLQGLATRRIFVPNLTSRNFHREDLAKGGDYSKRQIIGEYSLELHHAEQMFQARLV